MNKQAQALAHDVRRKAALMYFFLHFDKGESIKIFNKQMI